MWPFQSRQRSNDRVPVDATTEIRARAVARGLARLRAGYDAATTTDRNRKHWANADLLSPDAVNNPAARATLRSRARYEFENNSYARGMVLTYANEVVGVGPRLQLLTNDEDLNRRVEESVSRHMEAIGLAAKLRVMEIGQKRDGEIFGVFTTNDAVQHAVKLDIRLVEPDQVTQPLARPSTPLEVDGIQYDDKANAIAYWILREHPGSLGISGSPLLAERVEAANVIHYFRAERAGQGRGVPWITPALPVFAQLRRFISATLHAAELAATIAGVIESPPSGGDAAQLQPLDPIELEPNAFLTMPQGWLLKQIDAKHPNTNFEMFKAEMIAEAARTLNMPRNVALCDSSDYNYASGRLDDQVFGRQIMIDRRAQAAAVLNRYLREFLRELVLVDTTIPRAVADLDKLRFMWFWPGKKHVDPAKEAVAQAQRLENGTTNLAIECGEDGRDWREVVMGRAQEIALMRKLGVPVLNEFGVPIERDGASKSATRRASDKAVEEQDQEETKNAA